MTIRVLLLSRYDRLGASSRLRSYQYLSFLRSRGFEFLIAPLFGDDYVEGLYSGNVSIASVVRSYASRLLVMVKASRFDVIWIEKEVFPWLPGRVDLSVLPASVSVVVDYDDAIFHRYDHHRSVLVRKILGKKLDGIMRRADLVIVGNDYLRDRAILAGARRVESLPTVVDTERYLAAWLPTGRPLTIGWIGTPSTAHFLKLVAPVLHEMVALGYRVVAVGPNPEQLKGLPIDVKAWSEQDEVKEIQQFDIGIMPLPDEPFERGKCGYKLIQYMACGKPVVASPVGANKVIVRDGVEGFLATTMEQWREALKRLCDDMELRQRMGSLGRARVEAEYSLHTAAPRLVSLMCSLA